MTTGNTPLKTFYDPLYEIVAFASREQERAKYFGAESITLLDGEAIAKLLDTYEMHRLNFLRQAGLAWLVYPSATHTRFAHSIGCWVLGEMAMWDVNVRPNLSAGVGRKPRAKQAVWKLNQYAGDLSEEFMLALLFHDIGHFPFSHVLECNPAVIREGITHEEVSCHLILGAGRCFEGFRKATERRILSHRTGDSPKFLNEVLRELSPAIELPALCYLISLNPGFLDQLPGIRSKEMVALLAELVSGVLDLDRVDHYRRDSYFIGARLGELSVTGLLNGLTVGMLHGKPHLQLTEEGIAHACHLLFNKDMLRRNVFRNPTVVAYDQMLNLAVSRYLDYHPEKLWDVLFSNDDELLAELQGNDDPVIRDLVFRIYNRRPYNMVGAFVATAKDLQRAQLLELEVLVREELSLSGDDALRVSISIPRAFGEPNQSEWLELDRVLDLSKTPVSGLPGHQHFVRYVRDADENYGKVFWVLASDRDIAERASRILRDAGRGGRFRCVYEPRHEFI